MEFDLHYSSEIVKLILSVILDHAGTLLLHGFVGFMIGCIVAFVLYRVLRTRTCFKRVAVTRGRKVLYFFIRSSFYLGIIGISCTIALIIGSNRIVKMEVDMLVEEGTAYIATNYFQDKDFLDNAFQVYDKLYSSGKKINEINHALAEGMATAVAEEYHLGFLGPYLLKSQVDQTVKQLEELEKGIILIFVAKALEQIQAEELIVPEKLDDAFYAWLHNEKDQEFTDINQVISHQIMRHLKPLVFSMWLPFIFINSILILITLIEVIVFQYRAKRAVQ